MRESKIITDEQKIIDLLEKDLDEDNIGEGDTFGDEPPPWQCKEISDRTGLSLGRVCDLFARAFKDEGRLLAKAMRRLAIIPLNDGWLMCTYQFPSLFEDPPYWPWDAYLG